MIEMRFEPLVYLLMHDLPNLAYMAWEETNFKHEHPDQPYAPDWEAYQAQETSGKLRLISMREDEKLIGYASIVIGTDIHRKNVMTGTFRDIYVLPDKRGYAPCFVNFIQNRLREIGVRRMYGAERLVGGKERTQVGDFYEIMGFEPQECLWGKTIGSVIH